jgi:spermidine synthase
MYHAIPIGLTTLVIYLFTLYLSSSGFTGKLAHRRFWNWILLCAFFGAALIGLFMALKITYKWNIPFYDSLLRWHVEIGIALAFTGIIHLTWHLSYYFGRNGRKSNENVPETRSETMTDSLLAGKLLMLAGFAGSSTQFILLREAVILGGGTEASTGLFLWIWLVIAAAGATAGGQQGTAGPGRMMWTLMAGIFLAPILFAAMNVVMLGPGETPTLFRTILILVITTAPATFISSLVFVRLSAIRQQTGGFVPGNSFGIETIGSVTAGVVTTMALTVQIANYRLYILMLLFSAAMTACLLSSHRRIRIAVWAGIIPLAAAALVFNPDAAARSILLRGVKVEKSIDTPYGNITYGIYGGEKTVFYDHRPLFFSGDIIRAEENIHYALLQRPAFDRVMVISGGLMKHIEQLAKHRTGEVLYLEHDPGVIAAEGAEDTIAGAMKIRVIKNDPVMYFRKNRDSFDAILQLIPPPSTLSVTRYFTGEYFRTVKEHLTSGGIFLCTPMPYYNYSPQSFRKGFSPVYNALKKTFRNVILIPGSSLYAIASDSSLSDSISVLASRSGIANDYVNSDYLDDNESRRRSENILAIMAGENSINTAARPVSAWFTNVLSLESRGLSGGVIAITALLVLIPFFFIRKGGAVMFASSAGLSGFGMIMIFILQMTTGNIYMLASLLLTLLMAGLAAGAAGRRLMSSRHLITCSLLLTVIYAATGLLSHSLVTASPALVLPFIFVTLVSAGFLTGKIYRFLTESGGQKTTGSVYASDLAGSAIGYLTVSTILVPLAGIGNVCYLLAVLILISGIFGLVTVKH